MSKSPMKDYSKLFETNAKTVKKEEIRREDSSSKKYQNLPAVSFQTRYDSLNFVNDLKSKLDAALMHNTRLLDENSVLGEMANDLRYQLKLATDKLIFFQKESQDTIKKTVNERQNLHLQLDFKQKNQEQQLARLLLQIKNLHTQRNTLQIAKDKQIQKLKNEYESNQIAQLQNLRNIQNNSKDLYEIQIKNLKDNLDEKQRQIQNNKAVQKLQKTRLTDEIKSLQNEVKYMKNFYNIELQSIKHNYENEIHGQKRRLEYEKETQVSAFNLKVKRLRKEVLQKNLQMQNMNKRMIYSEEMSSMEGDQFKKQKQLMLSQLKSNAIHAKNLLTRQKNKLEELGKLQIQNLTKLFQTNIQELNGENFKLKLLIQCKKQELKELYDENQRIKESYNKQNQLIRNENNELKKTMKDKELEFKGQIQTFKIKLANLLEYDLKSLSNYYENQIKAYIDRVHEFQKIITGLKDKLYNSIMENDEIRKGFQLEISKQRARVQDLKIKMATIQLEHKQHVSNLGSKVQLTSQTLIRQSEHKQKTKGQYEEQKKKYHYLANTKDKQISDLMVLMQNMKKLHENELKSVRTEKGDLRDELNSAHDQNKRIKQNFEEQLRIKDQRIKNITFSNEKQLQEIKDLQDKIEILQKNHIKLKKQYEHVQLINASIAQQLGLSKGFIQNLQLQSSAAIEDERTKMKAFLGTHEIGLRQYYEDKIKSKQKDIQSLKKMLSQKQQDIRDIVVKYNGLQKRFDIMMETTTKLRQFEEQVKHLGLDNNLIKNMAELFKK